MKLLAKIGCQGDVDWNDVSMLFQDWRFMPPNEILPVPPTENAWR